MEDSMFRRCVSVLILYLSFDIRVSGQGSESETKPRIISLHIQSDIKFRFATTQVTSRVANPHPNATEALFDVTLPNEAFISNFTMEIDGVMYPGEVKEKEEAKRQYERARSDGQSAGHISASPRETNKFVIEVNIAPESKINFYLTYQELLKRKLGFYEHVIYINPGQVVEDLKVDVVIQESREITTLRVPPLRNDIFHLTNIGALDSNSVAEVIRPTRTSAYIKYYPTVDDQKARSEQGNLGQFIVKYDVERMTDAGDVLVVDGYFVHFLAPEGLDPIPKDIMFVLDISGSMAGTKLAQLKEAMQIILDDLQEGDRFNILTFHTSTKLWRRKGLVPVNGRTVTEAKGFVSELRDLYSTNINAALTKGVKFLQSNAGEGERSPILIFLTDGQPTSGETNRDRILENLRRANRDAIPVFSMAFGRGADFNLVKEVSAMNNGLARKIYEDADAALQMTDFCDAISATLLKNIRFTYLDENVDMDSLTKHSFSNYFDGSEIVVAGKLSNPEVRTLNIVIDSNSVDGELTLTLDTDVGNSSLPTLSNLLDLGDLDFITERVWSYLTIKQLMDRNIQETNSTVRDENKQTALDISLKYNFVTPLTSMVVTKRNTSEDQGIVPEDEFPDILYPRPLPRGTVPFGQSFLRTGGGASNYGRRTGSSSPYTSSRGRSFGPSSISGSSSRRYKTPGSASSHGRRRMPVSSSQAIHPPPMNSAGMHGSMGASGTSHHNGVPLPPPTRLPPVPDHVPQPRAQPTRRPPVPDQDNGRSSKSGKSSPSTDDPTFLVTLKGMTLPLCFRSYPSSTFDREYLEELYREDGGVDITGIVSRRPNDDVELKEITIRVNSSSLIFSPHGATLNLTNVISDNNRTEFDGNVLEAIGDATLSVYKLTLTTGTEVVIIQQQSDTDVEYMSFYVVNSGGTARNGIIGAMLRQQISLRETGNRARIVLYSATGNRDRLRATRWALSPELASNLNIQSCWLLSQRYIRKFF